MIKCLAKLADRLRQMVGGAVHPHIKADGTVVMRNVYRWAVGQAPLLNQQEAEKETTT